MRLICSSLKSRKPNYCRWKNVAVYPFEITDDKPVKTKNYLQCKSYLLVELFAEDLLVHCANFCILDFLFFILDLWLLIRNIKLTKRSKYSSHPPRKALFINPPMSRYLLLSDIDRNLVYVLSLDVSTESRSEVATVVSVSEFPTPAAFLSFCCLSAGRKQVNWTRSGEWKPLSLSFLADKNRIFDKIYKILYTPPVLPPAGRVQRFF